MSENPQRDFGPKPTLEWIAVGKMIVDPIYQRDTKSAASQTLINRIAAEFRWARLQPLVVTPRPDGEYAILDGQHRRAGAIKAGIGALPCMIIPAGTIADEADAFVRLNAARVSVTSCQMYYSRVAAGDPDVATMQSVCARAGITICRYYKDAKTILPGETLAIEAIRGSIRAYSASAARAYRDRRGQIRAELIRGISAFVFKSPATVDIERLAAALEYIDARDIAFEARAVRLRTGQLVTDVIADAVARSYQAAYFPRSLAETPERPAAPPANIAATPVAPPARPEPKPFAPIMRTPVTAPNGGRAVSVAPPLGNGILICGCKRQFRPSFAGQVKCNVCGDKYAAAQTGEAAE